MPGQILTGLGAEETGVGETALELAASRTIAHHPLGPGQVEREKCFDVLFDGHAPDVEKNRPVRRDDSALTGMEETRRPRRANHMARFANPRSASRLRISGVATISAFAGAWNQRIQR